MAFRVAGMVSLLMLVAGCASVSATRQAPFPASSIAVPPTSAATLPPGHSIFSAPPTPAPPAADLSTEAGVLRHFFESDSGWLGHGLGGPSFGGRVYCAVDILGQSAVAAAVYVWTTCQEFYGTKSNVEQGTGVSAPVLLHVQGSGPKLRVTSWKMPGDGAMYQRDIDQMFPPAIAGRVMHGLSQSNVEHQLLQRAVADLPGA